MVAVMEVMQVAGVVKENLAVAAAREPMVVAKEDTEVKEKKDLEVVDGEGNRIRSRSERG